MAPSVYGTHITPLTTAVLATYGPVFEMGSGDFSTPLLHSICKRMNREMLTADTDKDWLLNFKDLASPEHKFIYVPVYELKDPSLWGKVGNQKWSVVFIDHRPGERRALDILRFKELAEIIVVHDTENPGYQYENSFKEFKYRYDYLRYSVRTTLVSNFIDVSKLF